MHPTLPHTDPSLLQAAVVLDPYAETIISRRTYGEMGPQLQYGAEGVLGLMPTWPQAASFVPSAEVSSPRGRNAREREKCMHTHAGTHTPPFLPFCASCPPAG